MTGSDGARIALRDVTRAYRQGRATVTAVDGVSLQIGPGETVAITGTSGAGKTTLLNLIGGHERPDSGSIAVDGVRVDELHRRAAARFRRTVGFVFRDFRLLEHLTVLDNVLTPLMGEPVGQAEINRALGLLRDVGLDCAGSLIAGQLSGGQRQRVVLARALVARPRLLLADEPTGALDSAMGEELLDVLSGLQQSLGFTMLLATHDPFVWAQCRRLVGMKDGAIVSDTVPVSEDLDREWQRISGTP